MTNEIFEIFKEINDGLILLLPLVNPFATLVLFLTLNKEISKFERNHQAKMISFYVFLVMVTTFYAGTAIMHAFNISIPGLRIAGGIIIFSIGFRMIFPINIHEESVEVEEKRTIKSNNVTFIPLSIPGTIGPGTISMIINWASIFKKNTQFSPWITYFLIPVLVFFIISIIVWIFLYSANLLFELIDKNGIAVISCLMGFLLVCIGVQLIINGTLDFFLNFRF